MRGGHQAGAWVGVGGHQAGGSRGLWGAWRVLGAWHQSDLCSLLPTGSATPTPRTSPGCRRSCGPRASLRIDSPAGSLPACGAQGARAWGQGACVSACTRGRGGELCEPGLRAVACGNRCVKRCVCVVPGAWVLCVHLCVSQMPGFCVHVILDSWVLCAHVGVRVRHLGFVCGCLCVCVPDAWVPCVPTRVRISPR